jgi:hypothetical protein
MGGHRPTFPNCPIPTDRLATQSAGRPEQHTQAPRPPREFVINLKTAKALGLNLSSDLVAIAEIE